MSLDKIRDLELEASVVREDMRNNFTAMRTFGEILEKSLEGPGTPWIDEKLDELYATKRSLRDRMLRIESQMRGLEGLITPTRNNSSSGVCVVGVPTPCTMGKPVKRELVWE
jgi:hypothetical protein